MILLRIGGPLVMIASAIVLAIAFNGMWKAQRYLQGNGLNQPIPLDQQGRQIIWAWMAAFVVGVILTVLGFR